MGIMIGYHVPDAALWPPLPPGQERSPGTDQRHAPKLLARVHAILTRLSLPILPRGGIPIARLDEGLCSMPNCMAPSQG